MERLTKDVSDVRLGGYTTQLSTKHNSFICHQNSEAISLPRPAESVQPDQCDQTVRLRQADADDNIMQGANVNWGKHACITKKCHNSYKLKY